MKIKEIRPTYKVKYRVIAPTTQRVDAAQVPEYMDVEISGADSSITPVYDGNGVYIGRDVTTASNTPFDMSFSGCFPVPGLPTSPEIRTSQFNDTVNYNSCVTLLSKSYLEDIYLGCDIRPETDPYMAKVVPGVGIALLQQALFDKTRFVHMMNPPDSRVISIASVLDPGYQVVAIERNDNAFIHYAKQRPTLTISDCGEQGYVSIDEDDDENIPRYYYDVPREDGTGADEVTLNAMALPGFAFKEWKGKGDCYLNGHMDAPVTLEGCEDASITLVMNESRDVGPVFEKVELIDFHFIHADTQLGGCPPNGYFGGKLTCLYEWSCSTGYTSDLRGKVIEVLCYDPEVTIDEIIECMERDRVPIVCLPNPDPGDEATPCSDTSYPINALYANAMAGTDGLPFVPVRFYHYAKSPAATSYLYDNNGLQGPSWLTCPPGGEYSITQYFVHVPDCGDIIKVGGPFIIRRSSSVNGVSFSVEKHGKILQTHCQWDNIECPEGEL